MKNIIYIKLILLSLFISFLANGQIINYKVENVSEYIWRNENELGNGTDTGLNFGAWKDIKDVELRAINGRGDMAGSFKLANGKRRIFVINSEPGTFKMIKYTRLGDFTAQGFQCVTSINNRGDVTFNITGENNLPIAKVWLFDEGLRKYQDESLSAAPVVNGSITFGINDNRRIIAQAPKEVPSSYESPSIPLTAVQPIQIPNFIPQVATWRGYVGSPGNMTSARELVFPIGYYNNLPSEVRGINQRGDVVGNSKGESAGEFFQKSSVMVAQYEPILESVQTGGYFIYSIIDNLEGIGTDINNNRQVCGIYYQKPSGGQRAFFYSPNARGCRLEQGWVDINPDRESSPSKLTDEGLVVGTYLASGAINRAFLWKLVNDDVGCFTKSPFDDFAYQPEGDFYDLTDLVRPYQTDDVSVKVLRSALDISSSDYVVGLAEDFEGNIYAYRVKLPSCTFGTPIFKKNYDWPITSGFPLQEKISKLGIVERVKIEYKSTDARGEIDEFIQFNSPEYQFKHTGLVHITINHKCDRSDPVKEDVLTVNVVFAPISRSANSNFSPSVARNRAIARNGAVKVYTEEEMKQEVCTGKGYDILIIQSVRPFYDILTSVDGTIKKNFEGNPGYDLPNNLYTDIVPRYIEQHNIANPNQRLTYQVLTNIDLLGEPGIRYTLKNYKAIIIPDGQPADFYATLKKHRKRLTDYATGGGTLIYLGNSSFDETLREINKDIDGNQLPYSLGEAAMSINYKFGTHLSKAKPPIHPLVDRLPLFDSVNTWSELVEMYKIFLIQTDEVFRDVQLDKQSEEAERKLVELCTKYLTALGVNLTNEEIKEYYCTSATVFGGGGWGESLVDFYDNFILSSVNKNASTAIDELDQYTGVHMFESLTAGRGRVIYNSMGLCWGIINNDLYYKYTHSNGYRFDNSSHIILQNIIAYIAPKLKEKIIASPSGVFPLHDLKNKLCLETCIEGVKNTDVKWHYYRKYANGAALIKKPVDDPNNFYFDGLSEWGAMEIVAEYNGKFDTVNIEVMKAGVYTYKNFGTSANPIIQRIRYRPGHEDKAGYTGTKPLLIICHGWQPFAVSGHSYPIGSNGEDGKYSLNNPLIKKWMDKGYEVIELDWTQYADYWDLSFSPKIKGLLNIVKSKFGKLEFLVDFIPDFWTVEESIWSDETNTAQGLPWTKEVPGLPAILNLSYTRDELSYKGSVHKLLVDELNQLVKVYRGNNIQYMTHSAGMGVMTRLVNDFNASYRCQRQQINYCDMYYDATRYGPSIVRHLEGFRQRDIQMVNYKTTNLTDWANGIFYAVDVTNNVMEYTDIKSSTEQIIEERRKRLVEKKPTNALQSTFVNLNDKYQSADVFKSTFEAIQNSAKIIESAASFAEIPYKMAKVRLELKYDGNYINPGAVHGWSWLHFLYNIDQNRGIVIKNEPGNPMAPYRAINPTTCKQMMELFTPLPNTFDFVLKQLEGGTTKTSADDVHRLEFLVTNNQQGEQIKFDSRWNGYDCADTSITVSRVVESLTGIEIIEDTVFSTGDRIRISADIPPPVKCTSIWGLKGQDENQFNILTKPGNKYNEPVVNDRFNTWGRVKLAHGFVCPNGTQSSNPNSGTCNVLDKEVEVFDAGIWFVKKGSDGKEEIKRFVQGENMDGFLNPNNPTLIYIHDVRSGAYKTGYKTKFTFSIDGQNLDLPSYWQNAGYNFAFFNYTQLADEDNYARVEEKFYNPESMRWRRSNGNFEETLFLTTPGTNLKQKTIKDFLLEELNAFNPTQPVRLVGHGLGAQLAVMAGERLASAQKLERVVLINPYFSFGPKTYLRNIPGISSDSTSGVINNIITALNRMKRLKHTVLLKLLLLFIPVYRV